VALTCFLSAFDKLTADTIAASYRSEGMTKPTRTEVRERRVGRCGEARRQGCSLIRSLL